MNLSTNLKIKSTTNKFEKKLVIKNFTNKFYQDVIKTYIKNFGVHFKIKFTNKNIYQ